MSIQKTTPTNLGAVRPTMVACDGGTTRYPHNVARHQALRLEQPGHKIIHCCGLECMRRHLMRLARDARWRARWVLQQAARRAAR